MAFQLDSNVYSKQRSLSDYMAVNEDRNIRRQQADQAGEANDIAIRAAKQKEEMDILGRGLAGATEQDYGQRREALIQQGVPPQFLPEQYQPSYVDAILTKTGYKAKPTGLQALMSPSGTPMLIDKTTGQYKEMTPFSDMVMPTEQAAPTQQGIQSSDLSPMTEPGSQPMQGITSKSSLDDVVSQMQAMEAGRAPLPAPNMQPMPPTNIPLVIADTPTLSTPVPPKPDVSNNPKAAQKLAEGEVDNYLEASKPLSAKDIKKRQESFAKISNGVQKFERESEFLISQIGRAIELLEKGKTGGLSSAVGGMVPMETDAGTLDELLNTIKANNVISTLQGVRESSPTGGAFGNQSDSENELLKAAKGSLNPVQTGLTLENLKIMRNTLPQVLREKQGLLQSSYPDLYKTPQQTPQDKATASPSKTIKWDELP